MEQPNNNRLLRELLAELLGTFLLVLMGQSALATMITGKLGHAGHGMVSVAWGVAVYFAVQAGNGVSSHFNPAVTVAMATLGKTAAAKVPLYLIAQYLGAFVASALTYALYRDWIMHYANGLYVSGPNATAQIFTCIPHDHVTTTTGVIDQIVGTGILLLVVSSITDPRRNIPEAAHPPLIGGLIASLIFSLAHNTMAPLNPARDVSPRVFTALIGYGTEVFSIRNYDFLLISVLAPHIGGVLGVWMYHLLIFIHYPSSTAVKKEALSDVPSPETATGLKKSTQSEE